MPDQAAFASLAAEVAWPLTLLVAWAMGEVGQRWLRLPRISTYAIVGFLLASPQLGLLPPRPTESVRVLASIAFGLILFEAGFRINVRWLRANPWIAVTSVAESALTFGAVFWLVRAHGVARDPALMLAALAMATSPAAVVRVITELRASGQVTERVMHLAALNTALAVLLLKVLVGLTPAADPGDVTATTYDSVLVLGAATLSGMLMGAFVPGLLKAVRRTTHDGTIAYAIAVVVLAAVNHSLGLSPVLATLTFGVVSRNRRVFLTPTERGFGTLGSVLTVVLFVFGAVVLEWREVGAAMGLGVLIILVRQAVKLLAVGAFAFPSGISWRKGVCTGLALAPMSAIVLLVLEQSRELDLALLERLAPLAAASLVMEMLGPIVVGRALRHAQETPDAQEA